MSNSLIKEIRNELANAPDSYHKDLLEKKINRLELAVQESYQNKVGEVATKSKTRVGWIRCCLNAKCLGSNERKHSHPPPDPASYQISVASTPLSDDSAAEKNVMRRSITFVDDDDDESAYSRRRKYNGSKL